jgi:hypothetical protein
MTNLNKPHDFRLVIGLSQYHSRKAGSVWQTVPGLEGRLATPERVTRPAQSPSK